ncbi:cell division protein FtsK, partial [Pseudomonas qingdaonensis]
GKPSLRERILKREEPPAQPVEPREPTLAREPIVPPRETAPEALAPRETVVPRQQHAAPTIVPPSAAKAPEPSKRAMKEKQAPLFVDSAVEGTLPSISILDPAEQKKIEYSPESL